MIIKEMPVKSWKSDIISKIEKELQKNTIYDADIYSDDKYFGYEDDSNVTSICVTIYNGDWKHEHLYVDRLIKQIAEDNGLELENLGDTVFEKDGEDISDTYTATHNYLFTKKYSVNESYDSDYTYEDRYERIKSKSVPDFNGFYTDYTMYYDNEEDRFVFIFGDNDIYDPYNSEPDWECETEEEAEDWYNDYNGFEDDLNENLNKLIIKEKISDNDYSQSKTGKAYKVFKFKAGKLYPPMVANAGGKDTPVGVWLDAEPGEFIELDGLKRVIQKGGNKEKMMQRISNLDNLSPEERKAEIKKLKSSTLAYRPGWHLGDEPRATQFDREASWELVEELPEGVSSSGNVQSESTLAKKATPSNVGKYFYIKDLNTYALIIGNDIYFPYDFVWAECDYVADIDYQDEAMSYGYRNGKRFQHSLAGLPRVPEGGAYKYRTNPKPDTVPWVITGAIKVNKLLDDYDVKRILGGNAPERQGGNKTLSELGLKQI